jgi:hypothetical protein
VDLERYDLGRRRPEQCAGEDSAQEFSDHILEQVNCAPRRVQPTCARARII